LQRAATSFTDIEGGIADLLARREERPVFLQPAWLRTWISEFGEGCEPLFLAAPDSPLAGVAPLMRVDGRVSFIGDPSICDYMDFLVDPARADAYVELWRQLCDEDWSELDLWGLQATSPTRSAIEELARQAGYAVSSELEAVAPRLALPGDWEAYLASLGKKDRHELRRKIRRLFESGGGVSLDVLSEQADVVAAMGTFLDLHTGSRQDKTDFMTDGMASFFRRMASALSAEGLVRLFMLQINARPAAAVFCFDAGSCLYLYNSGYDPEFSPLSVGLVSKALCLRWAIENGKHAIDFLRGNEPYKYDLGARDQEIYRLSVRRPA
jgi:CelD/BcsL family acetyltransferase involved in cellulose biosynthesis